MHRPDEWPVDDGELATAAVGALTHDFLACVERRPRSDAKAMEA